MVQGVGQMETGSPHSRKPLAWPCAQARWSSSPSVIQKEIPHSCGWRRIWSKLSAKMCQKWFDLKLRFVAGFAIRSLTLLFSLPIHLYTFLKFSVGRHSAEARSRRCCRQAVRKRDRRKRMVALPEKRGEELPYGNRSAAQQATSTEYKMR